MTQCFFFVLFQVDQGSLLPCMSFACPLIALGKICLCCKQVQHSDDKQHCCMLHIVFVSAGVCVSYPSVCLTPTVTAAPCIQGVQAHRLGCDAHGLQVWTQQWCSVPRRCCSIVNNGAFRRQHRCLHKQHGLSSSCRCWCAWCKQRMWGRCAHRMWGCRRVSLDFCTIWLQHAIRDLVTLCTHLCICNRVVHHATAI